MPPAKSRAVVDDARSETSVANLKDRFASGAATSKLKKTTANASNGLASSSKAIAVTAPVTVPAAASSTAVESEPELPHIDWASMPVHYLHSYRSAYRLQLPSSFTQSHAELLYKSCDIAFRAPSQVLARKKAHDLKSYRRKQAQLNSNSRAAANGVSKSTRGSRTRDKDKDSNTDTSSRDGRRRTNNGKEKATNDEVSARLTVEAPPSPTSHPSNQDSLSNPADNASRTSRLTPLEQQQQVETDDPNVIPSTLNQADPESTILGSQSPGSLATSIRKHFNAQQLNEAETIARFTYVVRQQGSNTHSRMLPLAHRLGILPLPTLGAASSTVTAGSSTAAAASVLSGLPAAAPPTSSRPNTHYSVLTSTATSTMGGNHTQVEGSYGDGSGWIMGTTSCGRQMRTPGEGGGGTFRLRFRP
ncbi:hypothetical protein H2198_006828 [Neophaeococcomyces mojaviensis]|uniref:Uncharacterized protein n=1 Tax=Neophaeococcomyces mojaviensis TaxID=3383035 RepID=A0ACC3A1U4_9EURO|nr:hypothetical protein H2198_006828 [Knufia sp. JES_112]